MDVEVGHGLSGGGADVDADVVAVRAVVGLDGLLGLTTVRPVVEVDPAMIRPLEMPVMYADCTRIEAATGWRAEIPFEQTLRDVLDDWRERTRKNSQV